MQNELDEAVLKNSTFSDHKIRNQLSVITISPMINENPIEYGYPDLSIIFLHFSSYYFFKVPFKAMQNVIFGMFNLLYSNNREVEETDKVVLNA